MFKNRLTSRVAIVATVLIVLAAIQGTGFAFFGPVKEFVGVAYTAAAAPSDLVALRSSVLAPAEAWTRQFGTTDRDRVFAVSFDTAGNAYVAGYTDGPLPGYTELGSYDAFIRKYDPAGNIIWTRQFGTEFTDYAYGVSVDTAGNSYIAGYTSGTLPGQTSLGGGDAFIRKYDVSGTEVWTRQFGTALTDVAYGVDVDAAGNSYVTGYTPGALPGQTSSGSFDAFVRKYDAGGTEVWTRQFGTASQDLANDISVDAAGNSYVIGHISNGTLPGGGGSLGSQDAFIRKYDTAGNITWTRQFGTSGFDGANAISVDTLGNSYVAGNTTGAMPGPGSGALDTFVRKYDTAGNIVWTRQFGSSLDDIPEGISVDPAGISYVAGSTLGTLPGQASSGGQDAYVRQYDASGTATFTQQFGTAGIDNALNVGADAAGNNYVVGFISGALPGQTYSGTEDAFVRKYSDPAAANFSISGRVLTSVGRGIRGARITVSGGSLPVPVVVVVDEFGFYSVGSLPAGTYTVSAAQRRFSFSPPSRVITLSGNVTDAGFTGSAGAGPNLRQ
ncbi:MAG: SBBP repeat-containing protein [Pyrinomonadaceae bacterium]